MINYILMFFATPSLVGLVKSLLKDPETWIYISRTRAEILEQIPHSPLTRSVEIFHKSTNTFSLLLLDGKQGKVAMVSETGQEPDMLGRIDSWLLIRAIEQYIALPESSQREGALS